MSSNTNTERYSFTQASHRTLMSCVYVDTIVVFYTNSWKENSRSYSLDMLQFFYKLTSPFYDQKHATSLSYACHGPWGRARDMDMGMARNFYHTSFFLAIALSASALIWAAALDRKN